MKRILMIATALTGFVVGVPVDAATFKTITNQGGWGDYEAFPDVCKLANGDLLVAFYAGNSHISSPKPSLPKGGRLCMMRSKDQGSTWSKPCTLLDLEGDDRDPSLMQTRKGTVICNFIKYYGRRNVSATHEVWVTRSLDQGQTWEEPRQAPQVFPATTATSSPVIELADGTLLMPVYGRDTESKLPENKPGKRDRAAILRSTDDGKSWGQPAMVDSAPECHLQEPALASLNHGRLVCVMRPTMTQAFSTDDGRTWTKPEKLPYRGDSPYLLPIRDGVLLCAYRSKVGEETSVIISTDEAKTWSQPARIDGCLGAYPSMVELEDGRVLCVYYEEGKGSNIRQAVFRVKLAPQPTIELEEQH